MPREIRIFRFNLREIETALRESAQHQGPIYPNARLISIDTSDATIPAPQIRLKFALYNHAVSVSSAVLLTALTAYCAQRRIELPTSGASSLIPQPDSLDLKISMTHKKGATDTLEESTSTYEDEDKFVI